MGGQFRILLVDDESVVHETVGDYLNDCGHRVTRVSDGREALEAIRAEEFDFGLFDVRMPGMDGLALLDACCELRPQMRVIIISGHGDQTMSAEAMRRGAVEFLTKPIRLMDLELHLNRIGASSSRSEGVGTCC